MNLPEQIYTWLVQAKIIANSGEIDDKGKVTLPANHSNSLQSGFLVSEVIKKLATTLGRKTPSSLVNIKNDSSKNTKLTNWNFIWLAFEPISVKMDPRVKQLILQGQHALIVEVLRQLRERDPAKKQNSKISIKPKATNKPKNKTSQTVDIKKINLDKDPEEAESSLQFLILVLKTSLGMNLQQILGLFTNQNKFLAHIIVKGVNDNFQPIILFYSLLTKHITKLKTFHQQDPKDAESMLYAIKPGFISKNQKVAQLTLELFSKLDRIYQWFISEESKCTGTFLLGIKRHPILRELYWHLLLDIIQGQELQFFTQHYPKAFQTPTQQTQISTFLMKFIAQSFLGQKLTNIGVTATWLQIATKLPQLDTQTQLVAFDFIGDLMMYLPAVIEQNEESLNVFARNWNRRNLCQFSTLLNQLIYVLQKLADVKSPMARRVYLIISQVAKDIGSGDKLDYLVLNFLPVIAKYPSIPSQRMILHLRHSPLTEGEYLLICSSIQVCQDVEAMLAIGVFLRQLFIDNPLLNYNMLSLIKQVVNKILNSQGGLPFISSLLDDTLQQYAITEVKYKSKPKQQKSLYFGKSGSPEKVPKQMQQQQVIKQKWKELYLSMVMQITDTAFAQDHTDLKDLIKQKIMKANSYLKFNNHKVGSKQLQDLLLKRFSVSKDEQIQFSEQFRHHKQANQMEESSLRKSKVSNINLTNKLRGPENLTKEFQAMVERRKEQQEEKRVHQVKKHLIEEKKKINVRKQLQITNLLRGQIGQAQIRQQGYLQRLITDNRQTTLVPVDQLESRDIEAIQIMLKKYHRVLRHLFFLYTATMYSNHTAQAIEDNIRRKELLTAVQLGKMLKDYRFSGLITQPEINSMLRDINVKLMNKRQVHELDFKGFQQFIIQFCFLRMTIPHEVVITTSKGLLKVVKDLRDEPIHTLLKQFFAELKESFIARKQKINIFDDIEDVPLTKQQAYEVNIFNQKINSNPNYILPKGYKKIIDKHVEFPYKISQEIIGLSSKFQVCFDALDYIFNKAIGVHVMENIAEKSVTYKVKPIAIGAPDQAHRQRASSTVVAHKTPLGDLKHRGSSKGILGGVKASADMHASTQFIDKKEGTKEGKQGVKKRSISLAKLAQLVEARNQTIAKRKQEKQQKKKIEERQKKQLQKKRREQTEKFLEEQKQKYAEKHKKQQFERMKRLKDQEEVQQHKRENKQKFRNLQQQQMQRIKKIEAQTIQKSKNKKDEEYDQKWKVEQQKKRLRQKIQEDDKAIVQRKKAIDRKLTNLFQSQPIKSTFQKYEPNLKAIFNFLINQTHLSLTQKKHNNQIIYDTWRYFLNAFELSPLIVHAKDVVVIFKNLTKDKIVPKEYLIGLSYQEFSQALLRISIKYKSIFNLISQRIKDKIEQKPVEKEQSVAPQKGKKGAKGKPKESPQKPQPVTSHEQNQFGDSSPQINIKQLLRQNDSGKDDVDQYGDLTKVTDRTVRGLIYYLKVPNYKAGQEERFRNVLAEKHTASVQNAERLKEKLSEEYTFESPVKKNLQRKGSPRAVDSLGFNPNILQKS